MSSCALFVDERLASQVEKDESTAAKEGENGSGHEEKSEAIEEDMGEILMGETRCHDGPSEVVRPPSRCMRDG